MSSPAGACADCRDLQALIDAVSPLITSLADRITPDNAMTPQASIVRNAAHALAKAKRATCASSVAVYSIPLYTAPPSAPVGVEAAKHWHDLYRKECQLRQDDAARYGQQIVELEALAQQPAAVDGAVDLEIHAGPK